MNRPSRRSGVGSLLVAVVLAGYGSAAAQSPPAVFRALLADPKEPQFFAAYLWDDSPRLASRLASVGFGQTISVLRVADWQLSLAAAAFSQFNMQSVKNDLINIDYLVGIPIAYRHGALATRFRLYHQSSHLGDEYLLRTHAQRVDLSFEAAELLAAGEIGSWRFYGGGEYVFVHSPDDLQPGLLHGGVEYRQRGPLVHLGRFASGRLVAALDAKSVQDQDWRVAWSFVTGLEVSDPTAAPGSGWRWSVLLKAYTGPSPYGQFYRDRISSVGFGVGFTF